MMSDNLSINVNKGLRHKYYYIGILAFFEYYLLYLQSFLNYVLPQCKTIIPDRHWITIIMMNTTGNLLTKLLQHALKYLILLFMKVTAT